MITRYNSISLATGIPGLLLQVIGRITGQLWITLVGTALLIFGLAYYSMAKGRNPAWCLMAFLSLIGIIVLAFLKDMTIDQKER